MARFDVYQLTDQSERLLVDVQANLLGDLTSRVVVPLRPVSLGIREPLPRLKPILSVLGRPYLFLSTDISPFPARLLRSPVANLESEYRDDITRALDFLFQGF